MENSPPVPTDPPRPSTGLIPRALRIRRPKGRSLWTAPLREEQRVDPGTRRGQPLHSGKAKNKYGEQQKT